MVNAAHLSIFLIMYLPSVGVEGSERKIETHPRRARRMKAKYSLITFFSILLIPLWLFQTMALAQTQTGETLVVAMEDYPPYEMLEPVDGLRGFDYEVMEQVFALLGYKLNVSFLPWKRVLNYTRRGEVVGILTCAYRKEREEFIRYSDPISEFTSGFYIRKGFSGPQPKMLEDVVGLSVASVSAYESFKALQVAGVNPMEVRTTKNGIRMLLSKRFDYLYLAKQSTDFLIKQMQKSDKFEFYPINKQNFYFCFSKAHKGTELLVEAFNEALYTIRENGTYNKIHDKYR